MTKKQLGAIYVIITFMMIWGFDLINVVKYKEAINWKSGFTFFNFSQVFYIISTLFLTGFVFKRYYAPGKYGKLVLAIIGLFAYFILFRYSIEELLMPYFFGMSNYNPNTLFSFYVLDNIYYAAIYILLGFFVFLLDNQVSSRKKEALLMEQNREAELAFLRSQVNPHFLFNSLNNIYSLSYKKSDKAPEAILKLSELIRYMLYEKHTTIPVSKEWEYIQNFISLQQLRYDYPLKINLKSSGNLDGINIPPYLLIPFVENAFKHGDFTDDAFPLQIILIESGGQINFRVENKISKQQKDSDGGIGLENVKRRLALIYPNNQQLDINFTEQTFVIQLVINKNNGN